jgi:hypothetical protein
MSPPQKRRVSLGAISLGNKRLNSIPDDNQASAYDLVHSPEVSEDQKRVVHKHGQTKYGVAHANCTGRLEELDCSSSCADSDGWETDENGEDKALRQMHYHVPLYIFRVASAKSRGLNTIDVIDPLHESNAQYHDSLEQFNQADPTGLIDMLFIIFVGNTKFRPKRAHGPPLCFLSLCMKYEWSTLSTRGTCLST